MSKKKECIPTKNEEWRRHLEEYKTLRQDVRSRDSSTMIVGSILAYISFLIFVYAATNSQNTYVTYILTGTSIGLHSIWIIFYKSSQKLDDIYFEKMKKFLEPKLCFKIRQQIYDEIKCGCWFKFRRKFWYWAYVVLILVWAFLLLVKFIHQ